MSVTGTGPENVTAAGHNTTANGPTAAIILSWNGSAWTKVKVPKVGRHRGTRLRLRRPRRDDDLGLRAQHQLRGVVSNLTLRNG